MEKHFATNGWPRANAITKLEHNVPERRPHWSWNAEAARALDLAKRMNRRLASLSKRSAAVRALLDL